MTFLLMNNDCKYRNQRIKDSRYPYYYIVHEDCSVTKTVSKISNNIDSPTMLLFCRH